MGLILFTLNKLKLIMKCKLCLERGKTWRGDDPVCAFEDEGKHFFTNNNFACATMHRFRELIYELHNKGSKNLAYTKVIDQHYVVIAINEVFREFRIGDLSYLPPHGLTASWYKSRGRIETVTVFNEVETRMPDIEEFELIIEYLRKHNDCLGV